MNSLFAERDHYYEICSQFATCKIYFLNDGSWLTIIWENSVACLWEVTTHVEERMSK